MNFTINLATRVYVDGRKLNICIGAIVLLLLSWIAFSAYSFIDNLGQLRKFTDYKTRLAAKSGKATVSEGDYTKFLARVKTANNILLRKSYDWLALLESLERLVPSGVALRTLEPVEKGESLRITASARNFPAVRSFVEALESSKEFTEIYLTDQSNLKELNQIKGINFTITCKARHS
jgi:type IV pilus assembly protein PilN